METQIHYMAALSYVDVSLDELHEEFGDLPNEVKQRQKKVLELKAMVEETEKILAEIRRFCMVSKTTLSEMKDKEAKLAKQQFNVRNNREFDAISKEISHIKEEYSRLTDQIRVESVKEENLIKILAQQKIDLTEATADRDTKQQELEILASDQNDEVKELYRKRKAIVKLINEINIGEYDRIRKYHSDCVVKVRKNSCTGCYNAIPAQVIVDIRNNLEKSYFCESCGRILYPEDITIDDAFLNKLSKKK
ncbi:MAG: Zn-ribbon protein [Ignavibacteria bacterium]|nr:Zn-ribbon protein [Ignavibacteria bacterium]